MRSVAGRYTLEREVGRGGMGSVWFGHDLLLGRQVALKRVGIGPGETEPDRARARREATLAARVGHPHVIAVYDLVAEGDEQWLVMEYVEGTDLASFLARRGPLSPDEVAPLAAQVADALDAAHASGIVHRDVKPSNILVTADGRAKLSDFGIARAEADDLLTQTGLVTGSPAYLAPEVASGASATSASDVWSLGASVVHAVTGTPPYPIGDNVLAALYRIVNDPPPRPSEAGWLAPLIASTLVHDPDRRWSAAQARAFLEAGPPGRTAQTRVLPASRATAPPERHGVRRAAPQNRPGRRRAWLVGAVVAVVGLAVGGFLLGLANGDGGEQPAALTDGGSTPAAERRTSSEDPAASAPAGPTAAGMERFVSTYLATVMRSRPQGFELLTPEFQRASGGLAGYRDFWDDVRDVDLEEVSADVRSMTVTYEYRYRLDNGGEVEDTVRLRLVHTDGGYLIAGEPR